MLRFPMLRVPSVFLLGRILAVVLAVLGTARMGVGVLAWRAANGLERPSYTVLQRLDYGVELRRYSRYLVAETRVKAGATEGSTRSGGMNAGTGVGFRRVAGYIFGKNKPKARLAVSQPEGQASEGQASKGPRGEKMAMTAPVRTATPGDGSARVSFVMEKAYNRRTAPAPLDSSVRLKDIAPHILAARRFSGPPPSDKRIAKEKSRILQALDAAGLKAQTSGAESDTLIYGYHDPFITPNFLRRNEVCVRVAETAELRAREGP